LKNPVFCDLRADEADTNKKRAQCAYSFGAVRAVLTGMKDLPYDKKNQSDLMSMDNNPSPDWALVNNLL
jgi:hypothetical protein